MRGMKVPVVVFYVTMPADVFLLEGRPKSPEKWRFRSVLEALERGRAEVNQGFDLYESWFVAKRIRVLPIKDD